MRINKFLYRYRYLIFSIFFLMLNFYIDYLIYIVYFEFILILIGMVSCDFIYKKEKNILEFEDEVLNKTEINIKKNRLNDDSTLFENLPMPYAIISNNTIIEFNEKFKFLSDGEKIITNIIPNYKCETKIQYATIKNEYFSLYTDEIFSNNYDGKLNLVILIKKDIPLEDFEPNKMMIGLIIIDNYEELEEKIEETKISIIIALVEQKLNELSKELGAVIKKFDKEKFLFVLTEENLRYLKEDKFSIQNKIKDIDLGDKIQLTISIGIGQDGQTINQCMDSAKTSINLALGRGGDQVVVKEREKYLFYGGKSAEVTQNSRVRARVKAYALEELIHQSSEVIIMGHRNPDLDCLGSSIGIYKIASSKGKKSRIVINGVSTSTNLLYNKLVENKPYSDEVFINSDEALKIIKKNTLVVVVDCHISEIVECKELIELTKNIVVIDHHRKSASFIQQSVLTYHEPSASSTSELVSELVQYVNSVRLNSIEADALLAGITVDTKSFTFKTGVKTFEAAAFLKRCGADSINVRMLLQYDLESYKAKSIAINNAEIFNVNMAITICPSDIENPSLTTAQVADELLTISGVNASFVVCGNDNMVLISARSLRDVNVQVIMEMLGGGGHQTIAGAQILDLTVEEAVTKLKDTISIYLEGK